MNEAFKKVSVDRWLNGVKLMGMAEPMAMFPRKQRLIEIHGRHGFTMNRPR
jgi:hypothetical protein